MIYTIAQRNTAQQLETVQHQPEDSGEQYGQGDFHFNEVDDSYQGSNIDGMLYNLNILLHEVMALT